MNCSPNDKLRYVTAVDCILHCSDKNVVLTSSVAGARARPSQYLCKAVVPCQNKIILKNFGTTREIK